MCAKVSAAVRELTPTYEGKASLNVVQGTVDETKQRWAKFEQQDSHGLIGLDSAGKVLFALPGHKFGKDDVVTAIDGMLKK